MRKTKHSRELILIALIGLILSPLALKADVPGNEGATIDPRATPDKTPVEDRGVYAIWYKDKDYLLNLPFIKGGQITLKWPELEPKEGVYNFAPLDEQLMAFQRMNRKATVQVNGDKKPPWLFARVPHHPEKFDNQVRDAQGTLMYWHPVYINAYINFLAAYADHLKRSPYLQSIVGVRMNFNPLGTEHFEVPPDKRALDQWLVPPGAAQGTVWSPQARDDYKSRVTEAFLGDFNDRHLNVFVRDNIEDEILAKYQKLFDAGRLSWFHTGSEIEPRSAGNEKGYKRFYDYARSGKTLAYAEPWADAWGVRAGQDPRWVSPSKWNYWRLLFDLNNGVSYIAAYGDDLTVAYNGTHRGENASAYKSEFVNAFNFAAQYAGYHASPQMSPGAWVAFRQNDKNKLYKPLETFTGDYNFLMKRLPDDRSAGLNVDNVGPEDQRFGAWARVLPANQSMKFALDDAFAVSLNGKSATVRIIYLDNAEGSLQAAFSKRTFNVELRNSGRWKTAELSVPSAAFARDASGSYLTVTSGARHDVTLHMVNVVRGNGVPGEVRKVNVIPGKGTLTVNWTDAPDYDLAAVKIYNGTMLLQSVGASVQTAMLAGLNVGKPYTLTLRSVDEAGNESAGAQISITPQ